MTIKTIHRILTLAAVSAAALLASSCLDENPKFTQNSEIIFSTEDNADLALLGCYGYMTVNAGYGQMWQEVPIVGSGLGWCQRNGGDGDDLAALNVSISNALVSSAWDGMYKVIAEVNAFIEGMEESELSEDVKIQKEGEARFLRALSYYNLVAHFGDVPLKLTASTADGIAMSRTPKEEVFEAIIDDLEAASLISATSDVGRANSWTAKALLGKVYYKMAMLGIDEGLNLTLAKDCFDDVYNNGPYSLESNYRGLFIPYTESGHVYGSPEIIFQLNINSSSTICLNRASNRFAPTSSTSGISWGTYRVAKYVYDLHNGTYPGDPRMDTDYLLRWRHRTGNSQSSPAPMVGTELGPADSTYTYPFRELYSNTDSVVIFKIPYELFADPTNPTRDEFYSITTDYAEEHYGSASYYTNLRNLWSNFTTPGDSNKWPYFGKLYDEGQTGIYSNQHIIVYRYAEMLLLMADVYNELGQTSRAVELANEVLTRARNISVPASSQPANWSTGLSKAQVTEKLYYERIFELLGEPDLYDMTRIRGEEYLEKLLLKNNNHHMTVYADSLYHANVLAIADRVFNNGETDAFDPDFIRKNLLLPVPSSEIDANSAISNDDNNFGY